MADFDMRHLYEGGEDPGTVFSREDGRAPGSATPSEDISDYILPPANPDREESYFKQVNSSITETSQREGLAGDQDEPSDSTYPEPQEGGRRRRRSAQERIAQLTQQRREAERSNTELAQRFSEVQERLALQERELEALRRRPLTGPSTPESHTSSGQSAYDYAYPPRDSFDGAQAAMSQLSLDDIRRVVTETVAPIIQRDEERTRQEALGREHEAAWKQVVEEFPEFANAQSREAQTFAQIWQTHPLRNDGMGPLHVAYQVLGVLRDEARDEYGRTQRKRAAQVVPTGPTDAALLGQQTSEVTKLRKVFDDRMARIRHGSGDAADYIEARKAARRSLKRAGRYDIR